MDNRTETTPLARQLMGMCTAAGQAFQPWRDALVRQGAPVDAPLAHQLLHVSGPQARAVLQATAPRALQVADALRADEAARTR